MSLNSNYYRMILNVNALICDLHLNRLLSFGNLGEIFQFDCMNR